MKTCSRCKTSRAAEHFKPRPASRDGLDSWCRECRREYNRARYQPKPRPTVEQRFWSKVDKTDTCWLWTGWVQPTGYGVFSLTHDRQIHAHRWAYAATKGPIPAGLTIDHLCRVRHCVNPAHLEAVTMRVNVLRGGNPAAVNARKTHCPRGHPYDGPNLIVKRTGARACRTCENERQRLAKRRWREEQHAVRGDTSR